MSEHKRKAVFLDRDGVVIGTKIEFGKPIAISELEEVAILEGAEAAIDSLSRGGFELVVVTNQPDLADGFLTQKQVDEIHEFLRYKTGIRHFYVCAHNSEQKCDCRKPKSGLFRRAAIDLQLDLFSSFLVGDRWKDIEAGQNVGCECFFIDNNYKEKRPNPPYRRVESLVEASKLILGEVK